MRSPIGRQFVSPFKGKGMAKKHQNHNSGTHSRGGRNMIPSNNNHKRKKKIFLPDTSVILHDPRVLHSVGDNDIVITMSVLNKLEEFNTGVDELSTNSLYAINFIKEACGNNNAQKVVKLKTGGRLIIDTENGIRSLEPLISHKDTVDNRLLATAKKLSTAHQDTKVIVITNNPSILIKASAYGIKAEEYKNDQVDEIDKGVKEITNEKLYRNINSGSVLCPNDINVAKNECLIIKNGADQIEAIRYDDYLVPIQKHPNIFGIKPKNTEQKLAFELLLNPNISLVMLAGPAGTGKTLITLASAFAQMGKKLYNRIMVTRSMIAVDDKEMGFLPGNAQEKTLPWMAPIFDNIEELFLVNNISTDSDDVKDQMEDEKEKRSKDKKMKPKSQECSRQQPFRNKRVPPYQKLIDDGRLEVLPLALARGRTLPRQFIIVDEAQNLTGLQTKTIITRAGIGTKVVLLGDIDQIDSKYLTKKNNGLAVVTHRFKDSDIAGFMWLKESVRSELAKKGAELL